MNNQRFFTGMWRLADPKISITSLASMTIGGGVAAYEGVLSWRWHGVMFCALFCMEVAKNAWGDIYDYDSGTDLAVAPDDRTAFSGGKRVLVDALLTRRQTWLTAGLFSAGGILLGGVIVLCREPAVAWIGAVGLFLGWSYHGPPLQFAYRGLGELDVVICYGPLIAVATYMIQTHSGSAEVVWLAIALGIFIAAFLWVNEFPDHDADVQAGKRNLVVQVGKFRAARLLPLIYGLGFSMLLAAPVVTGLPRWIWLGFLALPPAVAATVWTWRDPYTFYRSKPVQPAALFAFVLYPAGCAIGLVLAG